MKGGSAAESSDNNTLQSSTSNRTTSAACATSITTQSLPSLLLTNANHITNKLDELHLLVVGSSPVIDIVAITESWLTKDIPISLCELPNFTIFRRDRREGLGGGVMCYVRDGLNSRIIEPLLPENDDFEVLLVAVRPRVLPRPLSLLLVMIVYCPPWYDAARRKALCKYITSSIDLFSRTHPNTGFLIVGDFNSLETNFLIKGHGLKQIVRGHTRAEKTLDKIFTNCAHFYRDPEILAPLGRSDHNCVLLKSSVDDREPVGYQSVKRRTFSKLAYDNIARELNSVNWSEMYKINDCQEQVNFLYSRINVAVDKCAPMCEFKQTNNDKPWITEYFKNSVEMRNKAFVSGDNTLYRVLRNRVNRLRKELCKRFYNQKIAKLKNQNNRLW